MKLKIKEAYMKGKLGDPEKCEDGWIITDDFAVVLDGATSLSDFTYQGKKLGRVIRDLILDIVPLLNPRWDCYQTIDFINEKIIEAYKQLGIYDEIKEDPTKYPAASAIFYSKQYRQIWLIGDCTALCGKEVIENKLAVDELYTKLRVEALNYLLQTGYTELQLLKNDLSSNVIEGLIKVQPYMRNVFNHSQYDYAVFDGFHKPEKSFLTILEVPKEIKELVFATDGYPKVFSTLEETEAYLKYIFEVDPLCYKEFPFFKCFNKEQGAFDDRCYLRFEIG